mgnify:FL=1
MDSYSSGPSAKTARQSAILEAVSQEEIGTQNDLVRSLKRRGISATQVSISRDIAQLGLIKAGGGYPTAPTDSAPPDPELPLRTFVRRVDPAGPNLVVIRCEAGSAQRVALTLDALPMEGLVGTIAGDDTVFAAADSAAANRRLVEFLKSRMTPRS